MTDPAETARRRLRMRSMRRGIKEMDLILSSFADAHLPAMDMDDLVTYESLLDQSDLDLYRWVSGQETAPDPFAPMVARITRHAVGLTRPTGT